MASSDKGPMDQLSAHLDRAWDLVGRGDFAGAMRSAEKSLEVEPDAPEVHNLMGYIRAQEGRAEEAVEHYERAIELDESFVEAMLNAAEVKLHPLRDWDGAIALIDDALGWIDDAEEKADAMLLKIDALLGKEDREGARVVARALPEGPFESPHIAFSIGRARFETGDIDASEGFLRTAIEKDPRNAEAHYYLGLVLQERGNARGAAIAFLCSRDAELRTAMRPGTSAPDQFERRVQGAIAKLRDDVARILEGALVIVGDVPGAEVVAEGVDPRMPVLLDDLSPEGEPPRVGRVFVYQRNVERTASGPIAIEEEIARALAEELEYVFPELVAKRTGAGEESRETRPTAREDDGAARSN
jgi:Flp pilus assembly protein TadD